jgi:hypothetical protein
MRIPTHLVNRIKSVESSGDLTRRANHLPQADTRQGLLRKIFVFTEIRNSANHPPSRPRERGDRTSSRTRVGVRWTQQCRRGCGEQGGQRIEPNPVSSPQAVWNERRLSPAKPLGEAGWLRTAKPCGPGCRCYSQASRRCISPTGRAASSSRGVTVTKRNSSPGSNCEVDL